MANEERAGVTLLGAASPDDIIGRPTLDFVHPDSREAAFLQKPFPPAVLASKVREVLDSDGEGTGE